MGAGIFLTAEWRDLVFLTYEADPRALQPYTPPGVEIDRWNGVAYVSIVAFRFLDTRLLGLAPPFHRDFLEVNLRFYVRRRVDGQTRRGVVFIKEIVPRRLIALVARATYNENYVALPMRHEVGADSARYEWRFQGAWNRIAAAGATDWRVPPSGSEEAFITDHYWGYAAQRNGSTLEYRVDRQSWRVAKADESELVCDVEKLYGRDIAAGMSSTPTSALLADGSKIAVRRGWRIHAKAND